MNKFPNVRQEPLFAAVYLRLRRQKHGVVLDEIVVRREWNETYVVEIHVWSKRPSTGGVQREECAATGRLVHKLNEGAVVEHRRCSRHERLLFPLRLVLHLSRLRSSPAKGRHEFMPKRHIVPSGMMVRDSALWG